MSKVSSEGRSTRPVTAGAAPAAPAGCWAAPETPRGAYRVLPTSPNSTRRASEASHSIAYSCRCFQVAGPHRNQGRAEQGMVVIKPATVMMGPRG